MKGGKAPLGYTIVEVMVVLAISTAMFVMASSFINGRQATTAFTQGTNDFTHRIQAVIDQVNDGEFSDINIQCNGGGGLITAPSLGGGQGQGKNAPCVFLGKDINLARDRTTYEVIPVAGSRLNNTGVAPTTLLTNEADAKFIDPLRTTSQIPQNLDIRNVRVKPVAAPIVNSYGLAFIIRGSLTGLPTGSSAALYYVSTLTTGIYNINDINQVVGANMQPAEFATICLTDGTRFARIYIGTDDGTTTNNNPGVVKLIDISRTAVAPAC
jgi:hypothetical protein